MSNRRVRTIPLFLNADACEHQNPDTYYEEASLSEERYEELREEYEQDHLYGDDFDICMLTPMGMGIEEWIKPVYLRGRMILGGYWSITEDFLIGWWKKS